MTYQLFYELLFGEGFWLGLLIFVGFGLFIGSRVRFSGIVFMIMFIFFGLEYLDNLAVNSNQMWGLIVCIVAMMFSTYQLYDDAVSK